MSSKNIFPKAHRFVIIYQKFDKKQKVLEQTYEVSGPIEVSPNTITVYSFSSKGIRSFTKSQIKSIHKIGSKVSLI